MNTDSFFPSRKRYGNRNKTEGEEWRDCVLCRNEIEVTFYRSVPAILAGWINFPHHSHLSDVNAIHATAQTRTLMFINFLQRAMP